ncbi:MAG TPA: hypothetical protein VH023_02215 [Rhodopila sp.]|jgi:hypothetical protein|nr:hypothetical protein [Rhodopila sp.]
MRSLNTAIILVAAIGLAGCVVETPVHHRPPPPPPIDYGRPPPPPDRPGPPPFPPPPGNPNYR